MNKISRVSFLYSKSKEEKLNLNSKRSTTLRTKTTLSPNILPSQGSAKISNLRQLKPHRLSLSLSYVQKKSHRRSSKTRCGRGRGGGSRGRKRGCRRRGRRRRRQGFQLDGANSDPEFILSISARWSGKELASSARRPLY